MNRQRGYLTEISSEPPASRGKPRGAIAAYGIVTRIDDPDRLGRVRVTLPTYGDLETEWMGANAGAGAGKGLVTLPDVDDQVLCCSRRATRRPAWCSAASTGSAAPPDTGIENGAVARYTLLTPGRPARAARRCPQAAAPREQRGQLCRARAGPRGAACRDRSPDRGAGPRHRDPGTGDRFPAEMTCEC